MHFIPLKKEPSIYSKYFAFAYCALLYQFFNSNCVIFVEGGRKNISCPRAQGTQATPLYEEGSTCANALYEHLQVKYYFQMAH